jgi:hypothetical protein
MGIDRPAGEAQVTETRPLYFFDTFFRDDNQDLIEDYTRNWHLIPANYPAGWCYGFWEPNRFLNRVIYHHLTSLDVKCSILDFACYDGLLVAALNDQGFDAYGYEAWPCWPMFDALGIADRVNRRKHCEAVIAFGIAHEYSFRDFMGRIEEENRGLPEVVFFDREITRGLHSKEYFDAAMLVKERITVTRFPNCISDRSRADLLIWRAKE